MNRQTGKRIACEFAIALMVCGAAHYFIVAPTERRAAEFAANADSVVAPTTGAALLSARSLDKLSASAQREAEGVLASSRLVEDQTDLLATITEIAERMHIRLERFEPGESRPQSLSTSPTPATGNTPADVASGATPAATDTVLDSVLSLTGSYGDVVRFIDALSTRVGYTSVTSIRITPTDRPGTVAAVVSAEHYGFAVPPRFEQAAAEQGGVR